MRMKIRRYYAHDCDSVNGFNNGYYIDADPIEVMNTDGAYQACYTALQESFVFSNTELDEIDQGYELITGYYDTNGNEISKTKFLEDETEVTHYSYVYVTFELIRDSAEMVIK